jgi:hypothetical protein
MLCIWALYICRCFYLDSGVIMTDANKTNSSNPDELASKLIHELATFGVQISSNMELELRAEIASSANPIDTYTTIRADLLRQLNSGLREEAQIGTATSVVLGVIILAIVGFISQCASFIQKATAPAIDTSVYQSCIQAYDSSYKDFCTQEAQRKYQEQQK